MAQNPVFSLLPLQLISEAQEQAPLRAIPTSRPAAPSDREFLNAEEFVRRLREFGGGKQE
jgi:hypothetical protein